jgi:hypothetical protein
MNFVLGIHLLIALSLGVAVKLVLSSLVLLFIIDALLYVSQAIAFVEELDHVFDVSVDVKNKVRINALQIWLDGIIFVGQD